jgi:hypothetical protein
MVKSNSLLVGLQIVSRDFLLSMGYAGAYYSPNGICKEVYYLRLPIGGFGSVEKDSRALLNDNKR